MDHFIQVLNLVMETYSTLLCITTVLDQRVLYYYVHITPIITAIMVVQLELNVIVRGYIDIMYMYISIRFY